MIYWLTGQPGAGKTTSGTSIMDLYPTKSVHIDCDTTNISEHQTFLYLKEKLNI